MNIKSLFAALLLAPTAAFAAVDLGQPASTPYDAYMRPVKQVLSSLQGHQTDMKRVQDLLRTGRSFRYSFTDPYTAATPAVTAQTKSGDCKAKSLWLADQIGDSSIRYVIGLARSSSKMSHAWLMWNDGRAWWILDPTNASRPIAADSVSKNEYIPQYSWNRSGSYRHNATTSYLTSTTIKTAKTLAVATGERR